MVESGHMPASHHDFALRDMAHSRSQAAAFARAAAGRRRRAGSRSFPAASSRPPRPGMSRASTRISPRASPAARHLIVDCCGAPALWSGRRALHDEITPAFAKPGAGSASQHRHGLLELPQDVRRIPAGAQGPLVVDGVDRDRPARRRARRRPRPLRDCTTLARAGARSTAQRAVRDLAAGLGVEVARTLRRGADDLLRLRRPRVLRQSGDCGPDRRPAHRRERRRLPDLLRDVPRQFRPPRQARGSSARPCLRRRPTAAIRPRGPIPASRGGATTASASKRGCCAKSGGKT